MGRSTGYVLPRFDSAPCFAALLGGPQHGRWAIAPAGPASKVTRRYLPGTAVLETTFETEAGAATLTDFMPLTEDEENVDVVRIVHGVRGQVDMAMELALRFAFGQAVPWVRPPRLRHERRRRTRRRGVAHAGAPRRARHEDPRGVLSREGESVPFTLSYHRSHRPPHFVADRTESLERTVSWWRAWSKQCSFHSPNRAWQEAVMRSLITLKLLTFKPTGGIVAAPTTSLPEIMGGSKNWDYRYGWIRDSAMTLYALLNAGYREEAEAWRQWLLRAAAGHPEQLQIMYGIAGERWLPELEVPWLPGYENSVPVRVGNGAMAQRQLDVFGELIEVLHASREADLGPLADAWRLQKSLLDHLEKIWREPDHGIWEKRGPARPYTHSRMMCWVAFDRAVKSCERFKLHGPDRALARGTRRDPCGHLRPRLRPGTQHVCPNLWRNALDAALLLIPQVGFLPTHDPRVAGTVAAIERELLRDGFVMRYSRESNDVDSDGARS
jgi:GH15 family glucan-1,4-alpha-glucosidase